MRPSSELVVFIIGAAPLGLFYGQLKAAFRSEGYFFLAAIAYLLLLRLLGRAIANRRRGTPREEPE
jgi:hypothetical protein